MDLQIHCLTAWIVLPKLHRVTTRFSLSALNLVFHVENTQEIVDKQAPGLMKEAERFLILSNIDRLWKEHLQALKFVQQAVGLRGYAQRDPLIEYKLEGYNLFLEMMAQIRRNVIYSIYQVCVQSSLFAFSWPYAPPVTLLVASHLTN